MRRHPEKAQAKLKNKEVKAVANASKFKYPKKQAFERNPGTWKKVHKPQKPVAL